MTTNLPLSPDRLWNDLMTMAEIGSTSKGGCNRQTLTDLDGEARHLLVRWGEAIGLTTEVDRVGNMRLSRPGRDPGRPAVAIGSHLDTQPTGGKFDGPLGVLAGLEIMRALHEVGAETEAPLVLLNWTNEEGARFTPPMVGSGTAMGLVREDDALIAADATGAVFGEELRRIGWQGEADPHSLQQLGAYFELHIEQGPILENEKADVGIVTHAAAQAWFEVQVTGAEAHAGSSMSARQDALVAASNLIIAVERIALEAGERGTVGRMTVSPDSRNVVPGHVWMTVEFRAGDAEVLLMMETAFRQEATKLVKARAVSVAVEPFWQGPVTPFDSVLVERLRNAARIRCLRHRDMPTVIGHDAVNMARRVPSALLFVPCIGGISHNEAENITRSWAAAGLHVLADAVLETAGLVR
jgi:beta-ureidopropionase / N-carbamoyl-L-amino-acid hydrolase